MEFYLFLSAVSTTGVPQHMPQAARLQWIRQCPLHKTPSDRAPELCLGESANYPVDLWAHGCLLEEYAHRRSSFPDKADYYVLINILKRLGTHKPPHASTPR